MTPFLLLMLGLACWLFLNLLVVILLAMCPRDERRERRL